MEEAFSEGRGSKLGYRKPYKGRGPGRCGVSADRGVPAGSIRGVDSLRAVATCYLRTSGEFFRFLEEAAEGDDVAIQMVMDLVMRVSAAPRGGLYYAPGPFRTGSA